MGSPAVERLERLWLSILKSIMWRGEAPMLRVYEGSLVEDRPGANAPASYRKYSLTDERTSHKYSQCVAVSKIILELQTSNPPRTMSQRDVYYALKSMFRKQAECNAIILDLGLMLGLRRHEMGILAQAKGLVAGLIRYRFHAKAKTNSMDEDSKDEDGNSDAEFEPSVSAWTDCTSSGPALIHSQHWLSLDEDDIEIQLPTGITDGHLPKPLFLLVVEKEGIFQRLVEDQIFLNKISPSILITACGYPDVATRRAVSLIAQRYPSLTVVGVADYNTHGLAVLLTYMLPSAATAHEARGFSVGGDRMHWMGMRTKHIEDLRRRQLDESHFQPFSENDAKHANALLRSPKLDELPDEFRNEVECMLEMRCKVELESLYALGLEVCSEWVQNSLQDLDWI